MKIESNRESIKQMEEILSLETNSISFQNVAMESKIKDDPEMLKYVNQALKKCKGLMVSQ